jgi:hypothetical protein
MIGSYGLDSIESRYRLMEGSLSNKLSCLKKC